MAWSHPEVEAIVADYIHMLLQELSGQSYSKTAHRKALIAKLDGRSEGAIERKHQNISAILIQLGCPYISGYKPLGNYQSLLKEVIENRIVADSVFDQAAITATALPAITPLTGDFSDLVVNAPKLALHSKEPRPSEYFQGALQRKDYLEREARNSSLGLAGEEFVLQYEHFRLRSLGQSSLADKVEHVAKTKGDGLGFDILSFETTGRERFIEVKTTSFGKETPFFISRGEVNFSESHVKDYYLYRLFEFRKSPRMFELTGAIKTHCSLSPVTYICEFS